MADTPETPETEDTPAGTMIERIAKAKETEDAKKSRKAAPENKAVTAPEGK